MQKVTSWAPIVSVLAGFGSLFFLPMIWLIVFSYPVMFFNPKRKAYAYMRWGAMTFEDWQDLVWDLFLMAAPLVFLIFHGYWIAVALCAVLAMSLALLGEK